MAEAIVWFLSLCSARTHTSGLPVSPFRSSAGSPQREALAGTDSIVTQEPATPASDPSHRTAPSCQALPPLLSPTREVESGQKTGTVASGHPLTAQSPSSARGCRKKEPQAQGRLGAGQAVPGRGPGDKELPFLTGVPLQAAGGLCAPRGHLLHRATFTFYSLHQSRSSQARGSSISSWRWSEGWGGQKDWPRGRKGAQPLPVPVPLRVNPN